MPRRKETPADKLDRIRAAAIDLVAAAIDDEDIPAAKRADMALSLLGKQAIKDTPPPPPEPVTITFRIIGDDDAICPAEDHTAEHTEVLAHVSDK